MAIDCEMVLCSGNKEAVAKICIVDSKLRVVYSNFVSQKNVVDYRFSVTGIRESDLENAPSEETVKKLVKLILDKKILNKVCY